MMKLRPIYESILNEIGDVSIPESSFSFSIGTNKKQTFDFDIDNIKYTTVIYLYTSNQSGFKLEEPEDVRLKIQFEVVGADSFEMTNANNALKVMAYVVSGTEFLIKKYNAKIRDEDSPIQISEIIYEPTAEESEPSIENRRNKLYQYYIQKMAKKYKSNISNSNFTIDSVKINFNPSILIK